ncbi:MAG: ATP-binding protein [Eubacteriales bacterium]|nr:ATP-binding protein [Eubacteriales bacterium]
MSYSREIYNKAYAIADDRHKRANDTAQRHREEVYRKIPQLSEIEHNLSSISIKAAKSVLKGSDVKEELSRLSEMSLALQAKSMKLLRENGYPADYLEPHYTCLVCNDTTFVEKDGKSVYCQCFLNLLKDCACEEINSLSPLKLSTFESFNLDYYPYDSTGEGVSPYQRMSKIYSFCVNYARDFDPSQSNSILMRGATGLGKTHLSLAVANEILRKGYYVVYVSAPDILSKLEKAHFNHNSLEEEQMISTLYECDLLIIDDLGTEYLTQYSKATIYNIFNGRIMKRLPMIINTNMTIRELETVYSERFVSRIMGNCYKLDFLGKDIRALKISK